MTIEQTLYVVKTLLRHYGEHPEQDRTIIDGALVLLDGAPIQTGAKQTERKEKPKPKQGAPKKEPKKRPPFDVGKLGALRKAGWSVDKIADEMGVSDQTVRNHMKKNGIE